MPRSFNSTAVAALAVSASMMGLATPSKVNKPEPVKPGAEEPQKGHIRSHDRFVPPAKGVEKRRAKRKAARAARKVNRPMYRSGKAKHQ